MRKVKKQNSKKETIREKGRWTWVKRMLKDKKLTKRKGLEEKIIVTETEAEKPG